MCEWSLACCGCIVATTADCQKRRLLFFNSLTVAKFENTVEALVSDHLENSEKWSQLELVAYENGLL